MAESTSIPFQDIIEHFDKGVCVVNTEQTILYCNQWLCRHLDRDADQLIGTPILDLVSSRAGEYFSVRLEQVFTTGQIDILSQTFNKYLIEIPIRDSQCYSLMQQKIVIHPLISGHRVSMAIIYIEDVTSDMDRISKLNHYRKNLEKMVKKRTRQLEISRDEALAAARAKSNFLATMSHELRTPLNGILGMTDLVLDTKLDKEQRECTEIIQSSGNSLLTILNNILDYAMFETDKMELESLDFNLHDCVHGVIDMLRPVATGKGLDLSCKFQSDVPRTVKGDQSKLRQLLNNIISNGIKFTHAGYVNVAIKTEHCNDTIPTIIFKISDTGIGIPREYQQSLFNPFSQQDSSPTRKYGGTGMGLAISLKIAKAMGGDITVQSTEGTGTVFTVAVALGASNDSDDAADHDTQQENKDYKILVVDDNPVNRKVLISILNKMGVESDEAENGEKAVKAVKGQHYDLVFMDCIMPELDGFNATAAIRKQKKKGAAHLPIIALTAKSLQGDRELCLKAGMDDYLTKPVSRKALEKIINNYLPLWDNA